MAPEHEHRRFPAWAERERRADLAWIEENLHRLWSAAKRGYEAMGRGALIIDTLTVVVEGNQSGNPMFYVSQSGIEEMGDRDALRMVQAYNPSWELIAVLLKSGDRESVYRIGVPSERPRK